MAGLVSGIFSGFVFLLSTDLTKRLIEKYNIPKNYGTSLKIAIGASIGCLFLFFIFLIVS